MLQIMIILIFVIFLFSLLFVSVFSKKKTSKKKIVIAGLAKSGKSTVQDNLNVNTNRIQNQLANEISKVDFEIILLKDQLTDQKRSNLISQFGNCDGIVLIVDTSNPTQFPIIKSYLEQILQISNNRPILILGNKVDIAGSASYIDIVTALDLKDLYTIDQTSKNETIPICLIMASLKQNFGFLSGIKWMLRII